MGHIFVYVTTNIQDTIWIQIHVHKVCILYAQVAPVCVYKAYF